LLKSAEQIEVRYWSSPKPRRDARRVEKFTIHENLLAQERASYPTARAGDFVNFPINHEDIAVLKLYRTHPVGSVSAFVSAVENQYTAIGGLGSSTWFYVYGAAVNGSFGKLQRGLSVNIDHLNGLCRASHRKRFILRAK
jgi:hypothetical protein